MSGSFCNIAYLAGHCHELQCKSFGDIIQPYYENLHGVIAYFRLSYRECGAAGLGSSPIGSAKRGSDYRYPSGSGRTMPTGVVMVILCAAVMTALSASRT